MLECQIEILVEWGHCDPARIVYNPNFFDWMEHGHSALFKAAGHGFAEMIARDPDLRGAPLVRSEADFLAPARLGDLIVLSSTIVRWGRSSFDIAYEFRLGDAKLVAATQTRVWSAVDAAGNLRAVPVPDEIRGALSEKRLVRYRVTPEETAAPD